MAQTVTELESLRSENARLQAELRRLAEAERRTLARRKRIGKEAGRTLLGLFDRQRVVRSFLELFESAQGYVGPREQWPSREEMLARTREFGLAFVRFTVRRRMLMLFISLLAFTVPAMQLYVMIQQNRIIENQNKYFNIQVYDTVARSITSGDLTAKQITAALLAREDFELLNGIIAQVFAADMGGAFTAEDATGAGLVMLRETAARGHLVAALTAAIPRQGARMPAPELWTRVKPTLGWVLDDAAARVPVLLRCDEADARQDAAVTQEVYRYLFNLGTLLRRSFSLAVSSGETDKYLATVTPFVASVARTPRPALSARPFAAVFQTAAQEWLIDLAVGQPFEAPAAPDPQPSAVPGLLREGLAKLKAGAAEQPVPWSGFQRWAGMP